MKEFLKSKFDNFTPEMLTNFKHEVSNFLPSSEFTNISKTPMWGIESNGIWYCRIVHENIEAVFLENNGYIHCIGNRFNQDYYDTSLSLYNELQNTTVRVGKPVEIDLNYSYIRFETPNNQIGTPMFPDLLGVSEYPVNLPEIKTADYIKEIIDQETVIYEALHRLGKFLPQGGIMAMRSRYRDDLGYYFVLFRQFNQTIEEVISFRRDNVLVYAKRADLLNSNGLMSFATTDPADLSAGGPIYQEILNYVEDKWKIYLN